MKNNSDSSSLPLALPATEARALTEKQLGGGAIAPFVQLVDAKIRSQCMEGKSSLMDPLASVPSSLRDSLSSGVEEAVYAHFRSLGYQVERKPDPDPGHPASRPYVLISW